MHICRTRKTTCMPTSLSPHLPKCFRAQHGVVGLETGRWVDQAEDGMHGFVNQGHSTESRREKEMVNDLVRGESGLKSAGKVRTTFSRSLARYGRQPYPAVFKLPNAASCFNTNLEGKAC